jgi:ribosomal-protein-alanine N-acetyltransferase
MTETVQPVADYAFEALGFESLIFGNAVGNQRSARIKEKSSAQYLRTEPAHYVDPALTQRELYELTKDTWIQSKAARVSKV